MTRPSRLIGFLASALLMSTAGADIVAPEEVTIENVQVSASLTGEPGDPVAGRATFANRKLGNCLACHANDDLSSELFHGEVGPTLNGSGGRWTEAQLRAIVVNSKAVFGEQTIMPGFYTLDVGKDVREELIGQTILTAQQVEDVVAYLTALK